VASEQGTMFTILFLFMSCAMTADTVVSMCLLFLMKNDLNLLSLPIDPLLWLYCIFKLFDPEVFSYIKKNKSEFCSAVSCVLGACSVSDISDVESYCRTMLKDRQIASDPSADLLQNRCPGHWTRSLLIQICLLLEKIVLKNLYLLNDSCRFLITMCACHL
jgi:hypothetical protein